MQGGSNGTRSTCPHCGSGEIHATRWTGLVERCVLYLWGWALIDAGVATGDSICAPSRTKKPPRGLPS